MPHLTIAYTPNGPRYLIDDYHELHTGDRIEIHYPTRIVTGTFAWNGELRDRPYILSTGWGGMIEETDDVRRAPAEPLFTSSPYVPPNSQALKDWERRGG